MEQVKLGNTDLSVSTLGLGCVTFGREIDAATSLEIMDHALDNGITLLDTAEIYGAGASERVVGDWLARRGVRDDIVLATKVAGTLSRQRVIESAEESLRRLKTDRIDLFQLHSWDDETPLEETLGALGELVTQGKARYCGCSNWTAWQLSKGLLSVHEHGSLGLQTVQPPYNLVQREIEPDLLPLCKDQGIGVLAYSPLGAGFLTGKYHRGGDVPAGTRFDVIPGHQPIYFTDNGWRVVEGLRQLASDVGQSMVRLALEWVLDQPHVTSVLVGARSFSHLDQALEAQATDLGTEIRDRLEKL